jgi:ribosomal protein S18 acetylase RimI-like enzyme
VTGLEVRRIRPAEHEAAGEVCVAAYDPLLTGAEDDYRDRLRDVATRDAQAEVWVAALDDRVVGVVTYCPPGSPWREIGRDDEGEFRMLAVAPAAQGMGVGEALVRLVLDRFREEGATAIVLSSLPQMADAHRLYERLGFVRTPERDWQPLPHIRLIAFRLDLQESPR